MLREDIAAAALDTRAQVGTPELPVPVDLIAETLADLFEERPFEGGIDGMTVCVPEGTIIAVNSNITSRGRRRFTVAHEIGHLRLHEGRFKCLTRDVGTTRAKDPRERQANQFAAELLMPAEEFSNAIGDGPPLWENILSAAAETAFDVSVTAAALRALALSDEQCMLVVTMNGRIEWSATSELFDVWTRRSGTSPRDSATAQAAAATPGEILDGYGDACLWLDDRRIREEELYLEEEALCMGGGRVLTLLVPEVELDLEELADQQDENSGRQ